jgi:hypothetical protein
MKTMKSIPMLKSSLVKILFNNKSIFFVLILLSSVALANPPLASTQQIGMFKNSKTCMVLDNSNISYNLFLTDAVKKYWKSTEFEFIDQVEFEKRRFESKYSFLVLMKGVFDKDPSGISYNYMSLVLGDAATEVTNMPEMCSIPISYSDEPNSDNGYAIPAIIQFMQKHAINLEKKRFIISLQGLKYYNHKENFNNKVLLLNKDNLALEVDSPEKIALVYPYYIKLITASQIQEEITANQANMVFNFHVGPTNVSGSGQCFEMIFDVEGNLYYYNYRKITNDNLDGFNLNDFRQIK